MLLFQRTGAQIPAPTLDSSQLSELQLQGLCGYPNTHDKHTDTYINHKKGGIKVPLNDLK